MWDGDRRLRPGLAPLASGGRTGVGSAMLLARSPPDPRPRPFRLGRSRGVSTLRLGRKPGPERGEAGPDTNRRVGRRAAGILITNELVAWRPAPLVSDETRCLTPLP